MTEKQALCPHMRFAANVEVARITDIGRFMADVTIHCEDCGLPFSFVGMGSGLSYESPMASVDATEARLPIRPGTGGVIEQMHRAGWPRANEEAPDA